MNAEDIMYELWFVYAEKLFNRVVEICNLNTEQIEALREVALHPSNFIIEFT